MSTSNGNSSTNACQLNGTKSLSSHSINELQQSSSITLRNETTPACTANNGIVVDNSIDSVNYYNSNNIATSGSVKVVNSNYKSIMDVVRENNKINVNNEKARLEILERQQQSTNNNRTTSHSISERSTVPNLAQEQIQVSKNQTQTSILNEHESKVEAIETKPQIEQISVGSTLSFQPSFKFNVNDIVPKTIDPIQLMQSIKSEEVLRTCQNVSNVLLQIPKYQEKLLNFSMNNDKLCYTDKCNNLTEMSVKCESAVLNVPDYGRSFGKYETNDNDGFFAVPEQPKELTSTLDLAEKRRKRKRERNTGIACSSDSEGDEEKDVDIWITKGPPAKPRYSEQKLAFLAMFGLTTYSTKNGENTNRSSRNATYMCRYSILS